MLSASRQFSSADLHQHCMIYWPRLADRVRSTPAAQWPESVADWLTDLTDGGNGMRPGNGNGIRVTKLASALAIVNVLGRLHRLETASGHDAFRPLRDRVLKSIRNCLSPQEIIQLLDAADVESRSLQYAFNGHAA